jgi:hypothetical protein
MQGHMKASLKITGSSFLLGCLAMGFTYRNQTEITHAIGGTQGVPLTLQRALEPGKAFEPLPEPKPGEWLAEHPEGDQAFNQFVRSYPYRPDARRDNIYLQPLGVFSEGRSPSIETLKEYASAFFAMDVKVLSPLMIDSAGIRGRRNPYTKNQQILTTDILALLIMLPIGLNESLRNRHKA